MVREFAYFSNQPAPEEYTSQNSSLLAGMRDAFGAEITAVKVDGDLVATKVDTSAEPVQDVDTIEVGEVWIRNSDGVPFTVIRDNHESMPVIDNHIIGVPQSISAESLKKNFTKKEEK